MDSRQAEFDVIIVGSGIAGLASAVRAAEQGAAVCILTKEAGPEETGTRYAQGGIVARGSHGDPDLLEQDILAAGCGLNNLEAVRIVSREGPKAVEDLLLARARVPFLRSADGSMDLT
ncbi:MAG TPA: FAD-dependent oxidoreductase, partial [Magnetospirillaceae bacterium]|nr:FAD-dependent oxidoreductase [Magnetospirillaceae bacterium]